MLRDLPTDSRAGTGHQDCFLCFLRADVCLRDGSVFLFDTSPADDCEGNQPDKDHFSVEFHLEVLES